jgi:hypothetical protein
MSDERRLEQAKDAFKYGDEDAREIALAEILTLGPAVKMPLEEYIPYLLSDLTENDK